jgi:hypothetical protein
MINVIMIMQHIAPCILCIALLSVSHTYAFVIDHAEQGPEEPPEPAQVEDTNPEQEQGKHWCIQPCP